jgi:hypothetical protein
VTADETLGRVGRNAVVIAAIFTGAALLIWGARAALGVAGGASLTLMSFLLLKRGTDRLADPAAPAVSRGRAAAFILLRYALLAFAAYVMIARLRLHPLGLLVGASSLVTAIVVEAATALHRRT